MATVRVAPFCDCYDGNHEYTILRVLGAFAVKRVAMGRPDVRLSLIA
jgi:hypothetical protein